MRGDCDAIVSCCDGACVLNWYVVIVFSGWYCLTVMIVCCSVVIVRLWCYAAVCCPFACCVCRVALAMFVRCWL